MAEPITVTITNLNSPIRTAKVSNKVAESAVTSVAGRVGDVLLTQADVAGLENVNNTSDLNKPISTATQAAIDTISLTPGPIGETGPIGPSGIQGPVGPSGSIGLTGPSGIQGPVGPSGSIGLTGPSGIQGPVGPSGSIGLTGPSGADAVVDNTPYGLSWSGDITQAATRDALYDKLETFSLSGHQHIASDITDLADGAISFTNKTLTDASNVIHADQLHFSVRAVGSDINRGQAVRYDSYQLGQDVINVRLSDHLTHISIGLAEENIANNSVGKIITAGIIENIDTSDYDEGEYVYVSQNGNLTKDEPLAGFDQPIAFCLKNNPSNGALQVLSAYPKQPSTDVRNDSTVSGLNVTQALDNLNTSIQSIKDSIGFACSDETSPLSVGQAIATDMPYDMLVSRVYASLTATGSLSATTIDIKQEGSSILNSTLSISAGANNGETNLFSGAASTFSLSKGDLLTIDITAIDTAGTDAGLKVYLEGEIN